MGDLDTTFGIGGKVITDFSNNDFCRSVAIQQDGKIILGCLLYTSPSPRDRTRSRMPSSA